MLQQIEESIGLKIAPEIAAKIEAQVKAHCKAKNAVYTFFSISSHPMVSQMYFVQVLETKKVEEDKFSQENLWFCFTYEGEETSCTPYFENVKDVAMYYLTMRKLIQKKFL